VNAERWEEKGVGGRNFAVLPLAPFSPILVAKPPMPFERTVECGIRYGKRGEEAVAAA
jgi:hypothetical protein